MCPQQFQNRLYYLFGLPSSMFVVEFNFKTLSSSSITWLQPEMESPYISKQGFYILAIFSLGEYFNVKLGFPKNISSSS